MRSEQLPTPARGQLGEKHRRWAQREDLKPHESMGNTDELNASTHPLEAGRQQRRLTERPEQLAESVEEPEEEVRTRGRAVRNR